MNQNSSVIARLRCEYFANPLSIESRVPRLSWCIETERGGARQVAYQVLAASSENVLESGAGDLWDSGRVESDRSIQVSYAGADLTSRQRVWWRVRVWDETGDVVESDTAFWEMGLLDPTDWRGQWIGAGLAGGPRTSPPSPFFRRSFSIAKPLVSARLFITALGLYEASINGHRVGDEVFAPGWTDYKTRVQYQVHDVSGLLRPGDNALGVILGDGWFCGHNGWHDREYYGGIRPMLLAQLELQFEDGTSATVATNDEWVTRFGPILSSDLLMGESYDARQEIAKWSEPIADPDQWKRVDIFPAPTITLSARTGPPVRAIEELKPLAAPTERPDLRGPKWIFDLGQNIVGRVRLKVNGQRGQTLALRYGEMLQPDGSLYVENLRGARATDVYTLRGDGEESWEPRFTFHGFRYVEISAPQGLHFERDAITGIVLHSDTPPTGGFSCSNPLLNQLQKNIDWSQRGNFLEVPTDCPQRDERLGWTGDAQVFIRTAAWNRDVASFFTKWQRDLADAQTPRGSIPAVAPWIDCVPDEGGPAWGDAVLICPWAIYLCYGDTRLLAEHYDSFVRFVSYLEKTSRDGLRGFEGADYFRGFGDWLALDGSDSNEGRTSKELLGTAYFAYSVHLLGKIAGVLGKADDEARYEALFEHVRSAFLQRYLSPDEASACDTQTSYVLALQFHLAPEELRDALVEQLVSDIRKRGNHLATGFVGTSLLPHALSAAGRNDVAYDLLLQKSWPSWLYAVTQGATTIWERWDGWTDEKGFQDVSMNSYNHYAYGAIGEWLYAKVAGIDIDPAQPAYKHILLAPVPGGGLTFTEGWIDSPYGRVESGWSISDGDFDWNIVVPPNTTATARTPDGEVQELAAGRHRLTCTLPAGN